jgi:ketosteroid isomerase-like protein
VGGIDVKIACLGLALTLMASGTAVAGPTPEVTVHDFIDAFDRGDGAAAAATNTADVTIIDEMSPHAWQGPSAFQGWAGAVMADAKAQGESGNKVTLEKTIRSQVDGDTAYLVTEAVYSYDKKGVATAERARMVFALRKDGADWKITAFAWAGDEPHATR